MLRGAIDYTSKDTISGWLFSEVGSVRGQQVLAFVDGLCVGAGKVDRFRQDLLDAGLGDGYSGFSFGITPSKPDDSLRAYVKLDGSDLTMIQPDCRIMTVEQARQIAPHPSRSLTSIEWFRSRGWLEQADYDFLKYINHFGVFDYSLRLTRAAALAAGFETHDPQAQAKSIFELILLQSAEVEVREFPSVTAFATNSHVVAANLPHPIVAIHSQTNGGLLVVEGSHEDKSAHVTSSLDGAIEYAFGPDKLLILDMHCQFSERPSKQNEEIRVFCPVAIGATANSI